MNLKIWFEHGPARCTTKDEAAAWLAREVKLVVELGGHTTAAAEDLVKTHLGYATGYFPIDVAERVYNLFGVEHPILGPPKRRAKYTRAELVNIGVALRALAGGKAPQRN